MPALGHVTTRPGVGEIVLRLLAAAGHAIDAYVHLDLAASYDTNAAAISQGALFRVEAAAAAVAAVLVLLVRGRLAALAAFLVAAGGVEAEDGTVYLGYNSAEYIGARAGVAADSAALDGLRRGSARIAATASGNDEPVATGEGAVSGEGTSSSRSAM